MKRIEMHIEHYLKGQFVGRHMVRAGSALTTFGSSREASIRLLGDGVSPLHACLDWDGGSWTLSDLGSEQGTWIRKQPIVADPIKVVTTVQMGHHTLKLTPIILKQELFGDERSKVAEATEGQTFHQVAVRRNGFLVATKLGDPKLSMSLQVQGVHLDLTPPMTSQWQIISRDNLEIRQRLVKAVELKDRKFRSPSGFIDPEMRTPVYAVFLVLALFGSAIFFMPQDPKGTMVALKPEQMNQYTRMIYDATKVKKQMAESQKLKKQMLAKAPEKVKATTVAASPKNDSGSGARVVNNIRSSGLKALIGKISARASKSAALVHAAGVAPDVAGSGVALGIGRTVGSAGLKEVGAGLGDGQRLNGVKTNGKGGGSGAYKGVGGLAIGKVGQATVGVLDDETEVAGGLDKEVISRYIKSQLGQIRYCYERQLSANPDIYGKVMVKFTIGSSGAVTAQAVGNSSLNNAMVEGCILRRVAGWQFPAPNGGTQVLVSYPFLFKSTR